MTILSPNQAICTNKLQAHKSSFQAWKCVSFGCSLLAIVLLLSKWYEVTTDLHLLLGIDQLLSLQQQQQVGNNNSIGSITWPPVPLEMLLPAANESSFGMESMENNGTMLMSHMHMSLNREHNANQLLQKEVDAFVAEFRNAKSTLSLSSLLVSVYIVSWILMTLAINDTRISNDISLRNILLLSVFGAIDVAASVGFVMVRLIMYTVKNNSFAAEMLSSSGLKDTTVRLSSDQLTAFTALRLIAMRSCSAYIDVYVSVIVSLLTLLRVYAILRALTYYRRLRRLTDRNHRHHQFSNQAAESHKQIWSSSFYNAAANNGGLFAAAHHMISPQPNAAEHMSPHHDAPSGGYQQHCTGGGGDQSFRMAPISMAPNPVPGQYHQHGGTLPLEASQKSGTFRYQSASSMPTLSKLTSNHQQAASPQVVVMQQQQPQPQQQQQQQQQQQHQSTRAKSRQTNRSNAQPQSLLILPQQYHQHTLRRATVAPPPPPTTITGRRRATGSRTNAPDSPCAPDLLLVNGRAHRLVTEQQLLDEQQQSERLHTATQETAIKQSSGRPHADVTSTLPAGISFRDLEHDEELTATATEAELARGGVESDNVHAGTVFTLAHESSQQNLLAVDPTYNTVRSNGTTYAVLSADQLDKIGRKLLLSTTTTGGTAVRSKNNNNNSGSSKTATGRYKLVARYKQMRPFSTLMRGDNQQQHNKVRSVESASASSSTTSCGPDESDGSAVSQPNHHHQRQRKTVGARLLGMRQTEEFVADSMRGQKVFEVSGGGRSQNYLSGKCSRISTREKENSGADTTETETELAAGRSMLAAERSVSPLQQQTLWPYSSNDDVNQEEDEDEGRGVALGDNTGNNSPVCGQATTTSPAGLLPERSLLSQVHNKCFNGAEPLSDHGRAKKLAANCDQQANDNVTKPPGSFSGVDVVRCDQDDEDEDDDSTKQ